MSDLDIITETIPRVDVLTENGKIKTTHAVNDVVV